MTNAQIAERKNIYRCLRRLPDEKAALAIAYIRSLDDDDEPPLTESELAQIEESKADIAAGRFSTIEEVMARLANTL